VKVLKPILVSFSFRGFLANGQQRLAVTTLVGFSLEEGARRLVAEMDLWKTIAKATGGAVDEGYPKPRGEVLVYGSCHAPGGRRVPVLEVRVSVAPSAQGAVGIEKRLAVFGDRYWQGTAVQGRAGQERIPTSQKATAPIPFSEMALTWERSFGGKGFARNPVGKGVARVPVADGLECVPLPNIESPSELVTASTDRPEPAGFGPLDITWPQRQSNVGTYDARWLEQEFPGFARDTDPSFFSVAQPDQRIEGFFRGDEEYVLENLHPARAVIRGRLPAVAARVLLRRIDSRDTEDVRTQLDTVVFLPEEDLGILVFRGLAIAEDDASDIACVLAACEDLDTPRSLEHYVVAMDLRLDKDQSPIRALREDDLVPPFARNAGIAALLKKTESTIERRDKVVAQLRRQFAAAGMPDADAKVAELTRMPPGLEALAKPPDFADPESLTAYDLALEKADAYTREQADDAKREADAQFDELRRQGVLVEPAWGDGPPKPQLPDILAQAERAEFGLAPDLVEKLREVDEQQLVQYRAAAHHQRPAAPLTEDARAATRARFIELRGAGAATNGLDFTRYDLSRCDLEKADLREALLEGADLTEARALGADLSGAVLAHAMLRATSFDAAKLEGANLGGSTIDGATFAGAHLRGVILARAKLVSAVFRGADLRDASLLETEWGVVDFEAAWLESANFLKGLDLTGVRFCSAKLRKANFLEVRLDGVPFAHADLELVTFYKVSAKRADFRGTSLRRFHAVVECSLEGARFDGADLTDAFLRGADLRGASFDGAMLEGADLSECDLTGATFVGARGREISLMGANLTGATLSRANLMEARLQKARLDGADLSESNLYGANMGMIRADDRTKVDGANVTRAVFVPKRRIGAERA
jgi:uncharacterized protein YjbI with pentapeptide repeats